MSLNETVVLAIAEFVVELLILNYNAIICMEDRKALAYPIHIPSLPYQPNVVNNSHSLTQFGGFFFFGV